MPKEVNEGDKEESEVEISFSEKWERNVLTAEPIV